ARKISAALAEAIEAPLKADRGGPTAETRMSGTSTLALFVRGHPVAELTAADAEADGAPTLEELGRSLEDGLSLVVADQRRRAALQGTALRVFFALLILFAGILLLRLARHLFGRADEYLDDKSGALRPVTILDVPIVGAEAIGAAAALTIAIGR